jgi:hypothetical protein
MKLMNQPIKLMTKGVSPAGNSVSHSLPRRSNTTGGDNMANGFKALYHNTAGSFNTATGCQALNSNTTGIFNTATGVSAMVNITTGDYNTANGGSALFSNTTGNANTAYGVEALFGNTTGSDNIALANRRVPTSPLAAPILMSATVGLRANLVRFASATVTSREHLLPAFVEL